MRTPYLDFVIGQEAPEEGPNEIAYKLAGVLGRPHYAIHQALLAVNPTLSCLDSGMVIEPGYLRAIEEKMGKMMIAEVLPPR